MATDILDTRTDQLYCSLTCTLHDSAREDDLIELEDEDYDQYMYGALCIPCEEPYDAFIRDVGHGLGEEPRTLAQMEKQNGQSDNGRNQSSD